jgi:hypothetical protein
MGLNCQNNFLHWVIKPKKIIYELILTTKKPIVIVSPNTLMTNNLRALRKRAINMSAPNAPVASETPGLLRMSASGMLDKLD